MCHNRIDIVHFELKIALPLLKYIYLVKKKLYLYSCGPRISAHAFPTRWRARFLF